MQIKELKIGAETVAQAASGGSYALVCVVEPDLFRTS
jgi:hypothetical protein